MSPPPPRPVPPLFGRDEALALLGGALAPGVLTALVGPPGIGKSTLVAAILGGRSDAVWADLAHAATLDGAWGALGAALGVSLAGADAHDRLVTALAQRGRTTVVLDAAEHLDAAAWEGVGRLVAALPEVAWAVTSVVRPPAGRVLELGPLAPADAVALLVTRSRERALDAHVDAADPVWGALADRLGGLPLALELAAGRFGVLTPAQILERLDRPRLLTGGRHGTLDGALRYAWDLLGADDRAALAACAVFRGGFDLPAAEAVLGEEALDRLTALRERSALAWRDGRFHVFDGLRRLALAEGGDAVREAEARHRAWFAALGPALRRAANGPDAVRAITALRVELPNFEAAWLGARGEPDAAARIAIGLIASVRVHGPPGGADLLGDPVPLAHAVGGPVGVELLVEWAALRRYVDRLDEALATARAAVALAETVGDAAHTSFAVSELGQVHRHRGELPLARAAAVRSVELAPDAHRRGVGLATIAIYDYQAGDYPAALAGTEAALNAFRDAGSVRAAASATGNLGLVLLMRRSFAAAEPLLDEAIRVLKDVFPAPAYEVLVERAIVHTLHGRLELAAAALADARPRAEVAVPGRAGFVLYGEGLLSWAHGDVAAAAATLAAAAERLPTSFPRNRGTVLAFAAAAAGGPSLRDGLAEARAAGALPDLIAVLDAWAAGDPLPPPPEWESIDAQLARHLLGVAVSWRIDAEGRWFERPSGRVDLARRGPMRRILAALLRARTATPGAGLTVEDLFAAGWPGESALPEAASARVYTAIRELRGLGLEALLVRRAEGYLLDPELPVTPA